MSLLQGWRLASSASILDVFRDMSYVTCTYWQNATVLAASVPVLTFLLLTLTRPTARTLSAYFALGFLVAVGLLFTFTSSLFMMLLAFELLLLVSLYLLRLTAKSDRVLDAAAEMFFWTLAGSVALLVSFIFLFVGGFSGFMGCYAAQPLPTLVVMLLCFGFGVKLPV